MHALEDFTPYSKPPQDGTVSVAYFITQEVLVIWLRPAAGGASLIVSPADVVRDGEAILGDARMLPHEGCTIRVSRGEAARKEVQREFIWFQVGPVGRTEVMSALILTDLLRISPYHMRNNPSFSKCQVPTAQQPHIQDHRLIGEPRIEFAEIELVIMKLSIEVSPHIDRLFLFLIGRCLFL